MNLRSASASLAIAALCSAFALGSCRTSSRDDDSASLSRLAPVSIAAANETATTVPALSLAVTPPGAARDYERAVAQAALSYEFEKQSCEAISRGSRGDCLALAFEHFSDARAKAHAARMSGLAAN